MGTSRRDGAKRRGMTSVLVVDGQRAVAEALARAIGAEPGLRARAASTLTEAAAAVRARRPDVLVMDTGGPGATDAAASLAAALPDVSATIPLIVLSDRMDDLTRKTGSDAGAKAFVSKREPLTVLLEAIRRCDTGESLVDADDDGRLLGRSTRGRFQRGSERQRADRLSAREREVLQLMADGGTPAEIAARMDITPNTLRTHVQNILTKLGVHTRTQAVMVAVRYGKISARG